VVIAKRPFSTPRRYASVAWLGVDRENVFIDPDTDTDLRWESHKSRGVWVGMRWGSRLLRRSVTVDLGLLIILLLLEWLATRRRVRTLARSPLSCCGKVRSGDLDAGKLTELVSRRAYACRQVILVKTAEILSTLWKLR